MKIIKKIAAIMLSVMMVLGMCSVVGAADGSTGTGKITINNAVVGQTYNIYKILDLESYDAATEHYAYKAMPEWKNFLIGTDIKGTYVDVDSDDYVTWKSGADVAEFAKKALVYAKDTKHPITAKKTESATTTVVGATKTTVEFTDLDSGYYLVDSSVGTLCFLNTMTSGEVTIAEKNAAPIVKKEVQEDSTKNYGDTNTADIGQTVNFQTTITAQAGAQNYVLHDEMEAGLTFGSITGIKKNDEQTDIENRFYNVKRSIDTPSKITDNCTFEISFTQDFCDTLKANDKIIVTYSATLNENATVGATGNKNKTWLEYGEKPGIKTTPSETTTKTYEVPVFKYTLDADGTTKKGLGGAIFKLTKTDDETAASIKLIKTSTGTEKDTYRVAKSGETGTVDTITTSSTGDDKGKFTIKGLDADTYYLTETKQPDGYNKLSKAVKIVIDEEGKITVDDGATSTKLVEVENKTGSLLPSTGGMGTTLFYIFGAILVIGSGVVLITKKRMK